MNDSELPIDVATSTAGNNAIMAVQGHDPREDTTEKQHDDQPYRNDSMRLNLASTCALFDHGNPLPPSAVRVVFVL